VQEFCIKDLQDSSLLNFLENNDSMFSWKSEIFKNKKEFWKEKKLDTIIKMNEPGNKSTMAEENGFNLARNLKERKQNVQQIKETYKQIFNQKWGLNSVVTSLKLKDLKSILRVIKGCRVMVFDLRVSDLKLIEQFLIALTYLKNDNTTRKIILISDIMTWAKSANQNEEKIQEQKDWFKRISRKLTKNIMTKASNENKIVQSEEFANKKGQKRESKIKSLMSDKGVSEIEIDFFENSQKTPRSFIRKNSVKKDWKNEVLMKMKNIMEKNQEFLKKENQEVEDLGRRKGKFIRSVNQSQNESQLEKLDYTEKDRIQARVYESMKNDDFGEEDMQQIFGLKYEKMKTENRDFMGWDYWKEYTGKEYNWKNLKKLKKTNQ
jgi:hypothetical protein